MVPLFSVIDHLSGGVIFFKIWPNLKWSIFWKSKQFFGEFNSLKMQFFFDLKVEESNPERKKVATSTPAERMLIAASKKLIRIIRTCAVCSTEVDNSNFVEHIKSHRQSSTMYQCMECGECFAVKPSLEKHLKIEHKVWWFFLKNAGHYLSVSDPQFFGKKFCYF